MIKYCSLIFLVLFLNGCSSDEPIINSSSKNIVGFWRFSHAIPKEVVTDDDEITKKIENKISRIKGGTHWRFDSDGKTYEYELISKGEYELFELTYYLEGNMLHMHYKDIYDDIKTVEEFELSNNILTIYTDDTESYQSDFYETDVTKVIYGMVYKRDKDPLK